MQIDTGLFDHMVLQRNARDVSEARLTGTASTDGPVEARVTHGQRTLAGWKKIGEARRGRFAALLKGVPTGGPYEIALRVRPAKAKTPVVADLTVRDVLVGDVWVLAGQSNMEGCGARRWAAKGQPMTRAFFMDDHWAVARDPIHNIWEAVDPVHAVLDGGQRRAPNVTQGVGPGVAFGQEMHRLTGVPQGLIASAHGGTSLSQWDPALRGQGGGSLYGATLRRVRQNGGRVAGVAWYQGESEANADLAPLYTARMKKLVAAFRRDFGHASLPFVAVQLARVVMPGAPPAEPWNSVQEQQRLLPQTVKHCAVVPAIDLALDDLIHVGTADLHRLGRRLAGAMHALTAARVTPPIALRSVSAVINPDNQSTVDVIVDFDHVIGKLTAPGGRAQGFEVVDGWRPGYVYRTDLEGSRAIIRTTLPLGEMNTFCLHYGLGANPVCNVTDAGDRSLPVFGPLPTGEPVALTPFAQIFEVSAFQPGQGKLAGCGYPGDGSSLDFQRREFNERFASLRPEIDRQGKADRLVFYRLALVCTEPMRLCARFGYDGPVKAWVDGEEVYHDPHGTNPALTDQKSVPFRVGAGTHEFLVALGTNDGLAWGIFLRFQRLDVPKRLIRLGRGGYAMPELTTLHAATLPAGSGA